MKKTLLTFIALIAFFGSVYGAKETTPTVRTGAEIYASLTNDTTLQPLETTETIAVGRYISENNLVVDKDNVRKIQKANVAYLSKNLTKEKYQTFKGVLSNYTKAHYLIYSQDKAAVDDIDLSDEALNRSFELGRNVVLAMERLKYKGSKPKAKYAFLRECEGYFTNPETLAWLVARSDSLVGGITKDKKMAENDTDE